MEIESPHNLNVHVTRGTVYTRTAYYRVCWAWLVLPLLEAIVTAVLLCITIFLNKLPLLKSSKLGCWRRALKIQLLSELTVRKRRAMWAKFGDKTTVMLTKDEKAWNRLTRT